VSFSLAETFRDWQEVPGAAHGFTEEPVPLSVFVQDKKYLGNPELSTEQYEAVRHIEKVYYPDTYALLAASSDREIRDYWRQQCRMVNLITLEWGKGSGKDHICRTGALRIAYLLLCLPDPQAYYAMPAQDTIHLLNVASSAPQASRAFFAPLRRAVARPGNWFENMGVEVVEVRDPRQRYKARQQNVRALQDTIRFAHGVEAISGHSDADSQEGLNLLAGFMDEVDAFKSRAELAKLRGNQLRESSSSAESVLAMLQTSASTRFPEVYKVARISYPRYLGSTIQQLRARGQKDIEELGEKSRHYVSGPKATWEVNPRVPGKHVFAEDYREDPVMAAAKYECRPSRAVNPYFANMLAVEACLEEHPEPPLAVSYVRDGHAWRPSYSFAQRLYPVRGAAYAMHADMAISRDRAGIALAHVARWDEVTATGHDERGREVQVLEPRPVVRVDFSAAFEADIGADPPREIQVRWFRDLCFELIRRGFNIRLVTMDGFQCVSGDVDIPLLDGTTKTMRELEGSSPFWVYSISNGRIVPGLCTKAWCTGVREDMVEVELDNGEKVRTTSDHRWMLRDGSYRRADQLRPDDSLMPLYRRLRPLSKDWPEALYEQVWHPEPDGSGKRWRFTHSMVSHYCYGPVPKGWVTHHKNVTPSDNRPENLVQMTSREHSDLHARMAEGRFVQLWADPEWRAAHRERLSRYSTEVQLGKTGKDSRRYRHDITFEDILLTAQQLLAEGAALNWRPVAARLGCAQDLLYARLREAGFASWQEFKWSIQPQTASAAAMARYREKRRAVNHKVVAVRPSYPEKVYDLQVEEHHNFAVGAGVFVHNSADSLQIFEAHGIETDRVSTDLSEEPWRALRNLAYEDRLRGYKDPLLLAELAGLSKLPNGKIDHPADGSKDVADAVACACTGAIVLGGQEDPTGARAWVSGGWVTPERPGELPEGMPSGTGALAFDGELPDYHAAVPSQVGGDGWLFSDTGEAYTGMV
jgi:Intein splicing domain/HNH endonuclease